MPVRKEKLAFLKMWWVSVKEHPSGCIRGCELPTGNVWDPVMPVSSALSSERAAGEAGQSLLILEVRGVVSPGISDLCLFE